MLLPAITDEAVWCRYLIHQTKGGRYSEQKEIATDGEGVMMILPPIKGTFT
jgi:hypothetical protein